MAFGAYLGTVDTMLCKCHRWPICPDDAPLTEKPPTLDPADRIPMPKLSMDGAFLGPSSRDD